MRLTQLSNRFLLAMAVLTLSACATTPPAPPAPPSPSTPPSAPPPSSQNSDSNQVSQQAAPSPSGAETEDASQVGAAGSTDEERQAALDGQFEESLGEFDERLAREQIALQKKREAAAAGAPPPGSEAGDEAGDGFPGIEDDGEILVPPAPRTAASRGKPGENDIPPEADIPDGRDDDVVARQLREAAEQEPDPVLRKKLWDEYRAYKNNKG